MSLLGPRAAMWRLSSPLRSATIMSRWSLLRPLNHVQPLLICSQRSMCDYDRYEANEKRKNKRKMEKRFEGMKKERARMMKQPRSKQKDAYRREKDAISQVKRGRQSRHIMHDERRAGRGFESDDDMDGLSKKERLDRIQEKELQDRSKGDLLS